MLPPGETGNGNNDIVDNLKNIIKELESIFESSHDGIVVADENGLYIRVNINYEKITGVPREEILGRTAGEVVERGLISESATLKVLQEVKPYTSTQTFSTGRQSVVTGSPIFDADNKIFRVVTNVRDMTEINKLKAKLIESERKNSQYLRIVETLTEKQTFNSQMIYGSQKMKDVIDAALKFAKVDAPIMITGESGIGKEVIADFIYKNSLRKNAPFLKINCGAIPELLLESELFGYEGGAFTGAKKEGRTGLLEVADCGTVLLDEIGELSLPLQVKLLRFVQQKEFYRLGGKKLINVDVRIIAATNRDLSDMMKNKQFRSDLFYHLNVLRINIPPLRERKEDIILLAKFFLDKYNKKYNTQKKLSEEIYQIFAEYPWVGNVREMKNLLERLIVVCDKEEIYAGHLPEEMIKIPDIGIELREQTYKEAKEEFERNFLRRALEKHKSSRRAAEKIGVDHSTIVKKAAKLGIKLNYYFEKDTES